MSTTPTRGERFAAAVREQFDLGVDEQELLTEATRTLDLLDDLHAVIAAEGSTTTGSRGQSVIHPALIEARQMKIVLIRLTGSLGLAIADDAPATPSPSSLRSRQAAQVRWGKERAKARRRDEAG